MFLAAILNWNCRFQTSEFGLQIHQSEIFTELLYIYIVFVCDRETHSDGPVSTLTCLSVLLTECCITVCDAASTLKQHWVDISCLIELKPLY